MASFGLNDSDIETIKTVTSAFNGVEQVLVFGSRAMDTYKRGSDVDLAIKGDVGLDEISKIKAILEEETFMPYFFDVVAFNSLENQAFIEHINQYGKVIYERA